MKLIIDIPEELYRAYKDRPPMLGDAGIDMIAQAIANGTPLPEGHWIIMGDRYIKCSECGHITKTESPDIYNFCMVCGANMSENPTTSKPEISSFYGLRSYVGERSDKE